GNFRHGVREPQRSGRRPVRGKAEKRVRGRQAQLHPHARGHPRGRSRQAGYGAHLQGGRQRHAFPGFLLPLRRQEVMEFAVLGSGSGGNCSLVRHGRTCLMVDNGFSVAETEKRLARLRTEPESVSAILVTHEHGDHISGVARFAARYDIPVWMTPGCYAFAQHKGLPNAGLLMLSEPLVIGDLEVLPVAVPHDSREPAQYVFSDGARRFGLLTDLGRITPHVIECYSGLDALMLEANHDSEMLANGPYPHRLKRRVAG